MPGRSHGSICSLGVTEVGSKRLCVTSGLRLETLMPGGMCWPLSTASTQVVQHHFPSSGCAGWLENPCAKGNWKVAITFLSLSTSRWSGQRDPSFFMGFNHSQGWQCSLQFPGPDLAVPCVILQGNHSGKREIKGRTFLLRMTLKSYIAKTSSPKWENGGIEGCFSLFLCMPHHENINNKASSWFLVLPAASPGWHTEVRLLPRGWRGELCSRDSSAKNTLPVSRWGGHCFTLVPGGINGK